MARSGQAGKAGWRQLLSILLWGLFTGSALALGVWLLVVGTRRWRLDKFWTHFPPRLQEGCEDHKLIDICDGQKWLYLGLTTLVAAVSGLGILAIRVRATEPAKQGPPQPLNWFLRLLERQCFPKRFWVDWCGGLSGSDLCVVSTWLLINILWGCAILQRWLMEAYVLKDPSTPWWRLKLELICFSFAEMLFPNLLLLFYPITRGSVVLQVTGVSYPDAVRYHRWLGHATMWLVAAHSVGFWVSWASQGIDTFLEKALDQGDRVNNLMGSVSFLFGLPLWLTSLAYARRTNYDLFYKMHHVGFWGFMLFGVMHYQATFWYFLPGLLLYAVDAVYRITQIADRSVVVTAASCSHDGRVCCLAITAPNWGVPGTGYVWLNVPAISVSEWHPFEYIAVGGPQPTVLVHAKAYNRWTSALPQLVRKHGPGGLQMRVEGPYPELPVSPARYAGDALVLVVGGIGVTAALTVLQEMAALGLGLDMPALLVWAVRYPSELTFLGPKVLTKAREVGLKLQVHLHYTGDIAELEAAAEMQPNWHTEATAVIAVRTVAADATGAVQSPTYELLWQLEPLAPPPHNTAASLCPVLAVGGPVAQAAQKLAVHLAVFMGGFAAALAVRYHGVVLPEKMWYSGSLGAAYVVFITLGALSAGFLALAVSAVCARLRQRPTSSLHAPLLSNSHITLKADDEQDSEGVADAAPERHFVREMSPIVSPPATTAPVIERQQDSVRDNIRESDGDGCGCTEYMPGIPIVAGRPELQQLLGGWVAGMQDLPVEPGTQLSVRVFAMGPASMVAATQLVCDDINQRGFQGAAGLAASQVVVQFQRKTYEL